MKWFVFILLAIPLAGGSRLGADEIHDCARNGDLAGVERLLRKDRKLANRIDEASGDTPLACAVRAGRPDVVGSLIKAGARPDDRTGNGETALMFAVAPSDQRTMLLLTAMPMRLLQASPAARGSIRKELDALRGLGMKEHADATARFDVLKRLVEAGADLNAAMPITNGTALDLAIAFSNRPAVEFLLDHGADLKNNGNESRPVLGIAALFGDLEMTRLLLARGAGVNELHSSTGASPLHFAVVGGNLEIVRLLLDRGALVNAVNKQGAPALHAATWRDDLFNLLMERGADPSIRQSDGTTTLHKACHDGSPGLVERLLRLKPEINATDSSFYTPLLNAAEEGRADLMRLLVRAGASTKVSQMNGLQALHLAASSPSTEAVRFLLEQKSNLAIRGDGGETPLMFAAFSGRPETVELLLKSGAQVDTAAYQTKRTALMNAALGKAFMRKSEAGMEAPGVNWFFHEGGSPADYLKTATILLEHGASLQARDAEGKTPLHCAAMSGQSDIVALFLSKGAEVSAKDTRSGAPPLFHASYSGNPLTVELLLAAGAAVSEPDHHGFQPIHAAARGDQAEIIPLLIAKGADPCARESHDGTPLHLAAMDGKTAAARALLDHGAGLILTDQYGNTPLHLAATAGHLALVKLLLERHANVNLQDAKGNTPLHCAAVMNAGRPQVDASLSGSEENTRFTLEQVNQSKPDDKVSIARMLLKSGVKIDVKNRDGVTALDVARRFGTDEMIQVLSAGRDRSDR